MSWIQNAFTQRGYRVLFVPETAKMLKLLREETDDESYKNAALAKI